MNIEQDLLSKSTEKSDPIIGSRIDINGKRVKKSNSFIYTEDQVIDSMDKCCDNKSKYHSKKEIKICKDFIHNFEDELIETMTINEETSMRRFCKKYVSKTDCKSIAFPSTIINKINERNSDKNKIDL